MTTRHFPRKEKKLLPRKNEREIVRRNVALSRMETTHCRRCSHKEHTSYAVKNRADVTTAVHVTVSWIWTRHRRCQLSIGTAHSKCSNWLKKCLVFNNDETSRENLTLKLQINWTVSFSWVCRTIANIPTYNLTSSPHINANHLICSHKAIARK